MKKERTGVIYMATVNSKSYVGLTVNFEKRKHQHSYEVNHGGYHFHSAVRKYGADSVRWEILEDNIPEELLPEREKYWIAFYDTYRNGYNMTEGGEDSPAKSPKVAAKVSATKKAQAARGEHPAQRPEVRAKISETQKAQAARGEHHAQKPEFAKKISDSVNERISRGVYHTQQTKFKERMSEVLKDKAIRGEGFFSDEARKKARETHKRKIESGEHFSQQPDFKKKISDIQKDMAKKGEGFFSRESREKSSKTRKKNNAKNRLEKQQEAGQQFLLDNMEIDDE